MILPEPLGTLMTIAIIVAFAVQKPPSLIITGPALARRLAVHVAGERRASPLLQAPGPRLA